MQGTSPGLRTDPAARLADLARQRPEWCAWLQLLDQAHRALDDAGWSAPFSVAEYAGGADASARSAQAGRSSRSGVDSSGAAGCGAAAAPAIGRSSGCAASTAANGSTSGWDRWSWRIEVRG